MPKSKQQKEEILNQLTDRLNKMKSAVFVDYSGLNVKSVEQLRSSLREEDVSYQVAKKTLIKLALEKAGLKEIDIMSLPGQIAVAASEQDEVMPARLLKKFQKDNEALAILGGILEKKFVAEAKILELADLPTRDELIARVIGSIRAPLAGLVNVLQGGMRNFLNVLSAIKDQKA
ncbi:MAG: 50S ribosomal protein L10 [Candidatus Kerfeldbacteria bacterium CG08_land_8_20_14_0_20_40_16]|uniref:Large ribosomal subunit protein uL10 n=1 Tax=Candidatus Kerfeldbacteria bacterium CG08_land_8_20_14_0_20_40_16 TaxID=2014244 RepID=A0A2H0YVU2_9BACT|nr:MAG: 50S ribosomal protein L10 [Candidatus Kerfeldbacteria bacterium CG08_land_8_20_14_0_20_40_16]